MLCFAMLLGGWPLLGVFASSSFLPTLHYLVLPPAGPENENNQSNEEEAEENP